MRTETNLGPEADNSDINRCFFEIALKIFKFRPKSANFPSTGREITTNSVDFVVTALHANDLAALTVGCEKLPRNEEGTPALMRTLSHAQ